MRKFLNTTMILVLLGATNATAQWVVKLPQPTGPDAVGATRFSLVDTTRPETFTEDRSDHREILIRVWYPAKPASGAQPEPFWGRETQEIATRMAEFLRLPKGTFDDLARVPSHAYADAPLAKSRSPYPVLVFWHGQIPGLAAQNTAQMEELASHGYVVFSIGHTHESLVNIFPDGRVVPYSTTHLAALRQSLGQTSHLYPKFAAATDSKEKETLLRQLINGSPLLNESLRIWVKDTEFVLGELEKMNAGRRKNVFKGRLDLKRVGVFGMSFGGTTTGQVCAFDRRCKAGINMDGLQYGDLLNHPLERPFMFMNSEDAGTLNSLFFEQAKNAAYFVTVKGSKHFNYSDFSLFSPDYKKAGLLGPIAGERMERIISDYVLAFFDKYLKGKDALLLKGPSAHYPEVEFKSHSPQK